MRSFDNARESWHALNQHNDLKSLRYAVRLDGRSSLATSGCRSACWKAFLLFDTADTSTWPRILSSSRSAYNSIRAHFLRYLDNPDEVAEGFDPLSEETEVTKFSPWAQLRKDEELRAEIQQDVDRCMPENLYFRQPDTQRLLLDVLFVFCKLNPDVSYRQGMHEILAPILWVVERDAIDLGQSSRVLGEDAVINAVYDAEHIEHDTFAIFGQVMQCAKTFYEHSTHTGTENPMVSRSQRILNDYLPLVDQQLATHLGSIGIVPQVFLMRWIRLLFGREFSFDDMLGMWDVIFSEDPSLEIVDHICLVMLLRIRWQLIDADYNDALGLLLRYPEVEKEPVPQEFVLDALYLRDHMDYHGGSSIVSKYTGRPLQRAERPVTPPAIQRNITAFSGSLTQKTIQPDGRQASPSRVSFQPRNIETVLHTTAKNIYAGSERLGLGKAVRNAVDEVHRKAQELREAQATTPRRSIDARATHPTARLSERVAQLEERSRQLAKSMEDAVGDLWEYQRLASESKEVASDARSKDNVEKLSVAIAKVQFVQVYLADPELPLPEGDSPPAEHDQADSAAVEALPEEASVDSAKTLSPKPNAPSRVVTPARQVVRKRPTNENTYVEGLADPSSFDDLVTDEAEDRNELEKDDVAAESKSKTAARQAPKAALPEISRPRLEGSSLSWMLGQRETDSGSGPFGNASSFPPESRRSRGQLFGEEEDGFLTPHERREVGRKQKKPGDVGEQYENEGFDLGSLPHGKGNGG